MNSGSLRLALLVAAGLGVLAPAGARADLIDVQFGSTGPTASTQFSGAAVTGAAGDQWNYFRSGSGASALTDSLGAATGVSFTYSASGDYGVVPDQSAFYGTPAAALMQSFIYTSGTITITFDGLSPGEAFALYIYGQSDQASSNYGGTVTVNGTEQTALQNAGDSTFVAGDNYLLFQGTADADGTIAISDAVAQGRSQTMVNGIQLLAEPVPEPSALALFAVCLPALGLVRRRRRPA
jgi:PEP-CTERM motif